MGETASFLPRLWEIRPSYRVNLDEQGVTWKYPGAAVRSRPPLGPVPSCSVLPVHLDKGIRLSSCFRHRKIAIFEIICSCPYRGSHQCDSIFFFHCPDYTGLAPEDLTESYSSVIVQFSVPGDGNTQMKLTTYVAPGTPLRALHGCSYLVLLAAL